MIDVISTQALHHLAEVHGGHCVSIYLPTHPSGESATGEGPVRLKNLAAHAAAELRSLGWSAHDVHEALSAVHALQHDRAFWAHQGHGLAVFVTREQTWTYRLPGSVDELVVVADRLHIKPLLPGVSAGEGFYVLALSQNRVRLLHGSRSSMSELALHEIPDSLATALRFDDREPQLQSHGAQRTGTGHVAATFHGQGGRDDRHVDLDRFLAAVDAGVCELLDERAVLVLAGVEHVVARYRKLTRHPRVVDGVIAGNADRRRVDELHDAAWPLVQPLFESARLAARERIIEGSERTRTTLTDVVWAARDGRIRSLFVPLGAQRWGVVDEQTGEVLEHDVRRPGDRDLFDIAALDTLLTGGDVYAVAPADLPGPGPVAAELRY